MVLVPWCKCKCWCWSNILFKNKASVALSVVPLVILWIPVVCHFHSPWLHTYNLLHSAIHVFLSRIFPPLFQLYFSRQECLSPARLVGLMVGWMGSEPMDGPWHHGPGLLPSSKPSNRDPSVTTGPPAGHQRHQQRQHCHQHRHQDQHCQHHHNCQSPRQAIWNASVKAEKKDEGREWLLASHHLDLHLPSKINFWWVSSCFLPLLFEKPSHWSLISSRL